MGIDQSFYGKGALKAMLGGNNDGISQLFEVNIIIKAQLLLDFPTLFNIVIQFLLDSLRLILSIYAF